MSESKFVVITGMGGVHKMIGNRSNGLIVEDFDSSKRRFVSSRKHQFTPLDSISIYTIGGDTTPLFDVFKLMQEKLEEYPLPDKKADADETFGYLSSILPNYDPDQVYLSDVKKLIKWFTFLDDRNLLDFSEKENKEEEETTTEE